MLLCSFSDKEACEDGGENSARDDDLRSIDSQ